MAQCDFVPVAVLSTLAPVTVQTQVCGTMWFCTCSSQVNSYACNYTGTGMWHFVPVAATSPPTPETVQTQVCGTVWFCTCSSIVNSYTCKLFRHRYVAWCDFVPVAVLSTPASVVVNWCCGCWQLLVCADTVTLWVSAFFIVYCWCWCWCWQVSLCTVAVGVGRFHCVQILWVLAGFFVY